MTSNASSKSTGDVNWLNTTDNWTQADAEWINDRLVVRVSSLPTTYGTPSRTTNDNVVRNINEGRVFYNTSDHTLTISTDGTTSGYKQILAAKNVSVVDGTDQGTIKYTGSSAGITFNSLGITLPTVYSNVTIVSPFSSTFGSVNSDRGNFQFLRLIPQDQPTLENWNSTLTGSFGEITNHIAFNTTTGMLSKYYSAGLGWKNAQWGTPWGVVGRSVLALTSPKTITNSTDWTDTTLSALNVNLVTGRIYRATLSIPVAQLGGTDVTTSFRITNGAASTTFATLPNIYVRATESTPYCATATFTSSTTPSSTIKAQYKQSGTNAVSIPSGFQAELVIEDIGPSVPSP